MRKFKPAKRERIVGPRYSPTFNYDSLTRISKVAAERAEVDQFIKWTDELRPERDAMIEKARRENADPDGFTPDLWPLVQAILKQSPHVSLLRAKEMAAMR